jgi:hypothetical protein
MRNVKKIALFAFAVFLTCLPCYAQDVRGQQSAAERAVIAIIENMESFIRREHYVAHDSYRAFGFEASSSGETRSQGTLNNFYIIESWTDPVNLTVWTLAVARK